MLQLDILSGTQAGTQVVARRFPFVIGRTGDADLQLIEPGVWDRHLQIDLATQEKAFVLRSEPNAVLSVNGENLTETKLRNGDLLQLGAVTLRVSLTAPSQKGLRLREFAVWVLLALVCVAQVSIIYLLSR